MEYTKANLKMIYTMAMGYGTEAVGTLYRITVARSKNGAVIVDAGNR